MKTLGLLGSGQLARMTAIEAHRYGLNVHLFCFEKETSPAEHVASKIIKSDLSNTQNLKDFIDDCDIITLENEFIDQDVLNFIDHYAPGKLFPSARCFSLIGDKITEKETFKNAGLSVAPFKKVLTRWDVETFIEEHHLPVILKSSKGGYDGYGNVTIRSHSEIDDALKKLKGELLVEAFIPYEKECAIMIARNLKGEIETYPVAYTKQEQHICHFVEVPAPIDLDIQQKIKEMAIKAIEVINGVGVFAFEFFLTKDKILYLNESAPRPHNSGHYSIEGCETSQFQNHVRAVLNWPLGKTTLQSPHVLMLNLLGTKNQEADLSPMDDFLNCPKGYLHLYGKKNSKIGRKMGHFTLLGNDLNNMYETLNRLKKSYEL